MTDNCANCGEKIHDGGMFASPNYRVPDKDIKIVNQVLKTAYSELCNHCGKKIVEDSIGVLRNEMESCQSYFQDHITDFPMMTISQAPVNAKCRIKAMVTANVSVGTGIFNELSQGFSDMFGATNTTSGMAHKINSGESTARAIIVDKAMKMGANCVIGVDIDYGTTNNNAATVNMQGTAVSIANLDEILDEAEFDAAQKIQSAYSRAKELSWNLRGKFL